MLYIVTNRVSNRAGHIETTTYDWHVGEGVPGINNKFFLVGEYLVEIQADGDELEHIKTNFPNMPFNKNARVMRWFGDLAKIIYYNLTMT